MSQSSTSGIRLFTEIYAIMNYVRLAFECKKLVDWNAQWKSYNRNKNNGQNKQDKLEPRQSNAHHTPCPSDALQDTTATHAASRND